MTTGLQLNDRTQVLLERILATADLQRIGRSIVDNTTVLDFGVKTCGSLQAGVSLAELCMAGLGTVELQAANATIDLPQVFVRTDHPLHACLLSQYAGWKIATDDYFAMGSGPMRATAASEDLFVEFPVSEHKEVCVGVLEAGSLPGTSAIAAIRRGVGDVKQLAIAVAPTASLAGNLQVVARSVETALHKLHELHFPVDAIVSGCGTAPLPPVARNDLAGIGRTNDSILYGATVNLWVDCDDDLLADIGPRTPSASSLSHGRPFLELFQEANHDFYALDKALFSPAVLIFHNLKSGRSFRFGKLMPELLHVSFGM
ncbi:MAG: methenyltetrahydromethanopterin cyclohydrolase [Planctomycetaceae bacterium]